MSVAQMQAEEELLEAIGLLHEAVAQAGGFSWHQDALYIVEQAALAHLGLTPDSSSPLSLEGVSS